MTAAAETYCRRVICCITVPAPAANQHVRPIASAPGIRRYPLVSFRRTILLMCHAFSRMNRTSFLSTGRLKRSWQAPGHEDQWYNPFP